MKCNLFGSSKTWIVCGILAAVSIPLSARSQQAKADSKKSASNSAPAAVQTPQAVFVIPRTEQEGRDPFFPKSRYIYAKAPVLTTPTTAQPIVRHIDLKLQGISGPPNHRLPIINGRTFEVGEEGEVPSPEGRINVRVVDIKGNTVSVFAAGERQTLTLKDGL